jgi:hypothetical protein
VIETVDNKVDKNFNPFPGLRPFGTDESFLYFGREGQSDEVLSILEENRYVNILGSSGTGKSSLMFSGVIPTLHGGFITKAGIDWEIITAKPGLNPIRNLAEGFRKHLEAKEDDENLDEITSIINQNLFEAILKKSTKGIADLYQFNKHLKGKNLLIYLDQFEEIFRFRKLGTLYHLNESLAYVNLILEAVNQTELPIYIASSMRSDFLGDCEQFPELTNKINDSHYLIPQMTRQQKQLVIKGPVAVGKGSISNRLVQRLLNDMGDRPDQLPVLQHALMRTWDYWIQSDREMKEPLDFIHYEAIGSVNEALSRHADEAYYELNDAQKIICERIFKTITEKRSDSDGIRRPTPLGEIAQIVDEEEFTLIPIIDKFREDGRALLTPRADIELTSESVIDISHEALMRVWYRLRNWVQEESESSQIYLNLAEAAKNYQKGSGSLWRPPDLQLALEWRNKTKPTLKWALQYDNNFESVISFLNRSEKAYKQEIETKEMLQKRRLKRSRVVAYILGTAAMLSVILLIVAYNQSVEAERQRALADERSDEARQNLEVAKENALKAQKQEAEANLSSFRANQERENAEYNFLIAREQTQIADSARKEALRIAEIARQNELAAKEARQEALEQAEETRVAQGQTQGFRMRAVAQALATKSLQIEDDQLRGLLAYLGYQFNEENEGYDSNNDVYNGLFYAVKALDNDYFNAFRSNSTDVRSLKFVANKYLYTTGTSGRINAWEVDNMTSNRSIVIFDKPDVFVKKIFVDEKNQILVALTDGADFYTISVGARVRTIQKYTIPNTFTFDVEFLDNSTDFLISASDSSIYKFSNGQLKQFLKVRSRVYDMELFDEETLVTGNSNGQLQLWNINNSRFVKNINERSNKYIHSLSIGDNMIAAGDNSGLVTLYPIDDNLKLEDPIILRGSDGEIMTDLTFNLAENQIIASSTKGTIRLWNLNDVDEFPMIISEPGSWVNSIALLNPSYIFAGCKDQVFRLYPIKSKILASTLRSMVTRDISEEEWDRYIGNDIEYDPVFKESVFVDNSQ